MKDEEEEEDDLRLACHQLLDCFTNPFGRYCLALLVILSLFVFVSEMCLKWNEGGEGEE